eukprot:gene8120-16664_t
MIGMKNSLLVIFCVLSLFHVQRCTGFMISKPNGVNVRLSETVHDKRVHPGKSLVLMSSSATKVETKADTGASIATSTFNLAKSIVGAGVLSLPSAVAFFSDDKLALIPSGILCTIFGLISAYSFSLIGKACEQHKAKSFQEAWGKSVDPKSSWLISAGVTSMCFLASIAYSIIIGDSFTAIFKTFNLPAIMTQRTNVILLMTTLFLLPLSLLKSLAALAPFSLLGLSGTLYTAVFMTIRFLDGSYAPGGKFFQLIAPTLRQSFGSRGPWAIDHLIFVLVSMLSTAYIAHYNAPSFYSELKDATMPRFNKVVTGAFGFSILTYLLVMAVGFLTFGGNVAGFCLNNYAGSDVLATAARVAIGGAIVTGFPFTFSALRDGIFDLLNKSTESRKSLFKPFTVGLLAVITSLSLVLKDVGFVVSLSGAMFGSILMFIVPALMNIRNTKDQAKAAGKELSTATKVELGVNYGMVGMGVLMTVLGVSVSVLRELGKL